MPCDGVTIRTLRPDDVEIFGRLLFEAFKDSLHRNRWKSLFAATKEAGKILGDQRVYFDASYIALDANSSAVSASVVASEKNGPFLSYIGTVAQYRRCGLAGELVKRSLKTMHSKGFIDLYLSVHPQNQNALSRYRSLGFEDFVIGKPLEQQ